MGYNFFLMPLSFYHGFEAAAPLSVSKYSDQMQRLLTYLDTLADAQIQDDTQQSRQNFSLRLETRLIRGKDTQTMAFRWTDDPSAPAVALREEDVLKTYPWTYDVLTENLRKRYSNFIVNNSYHGIRRPLEKNKKLVLTRSLNPDNPTSSKQRFYNPNIFNEFDKHYQRRTKA